MTQMPDTHQPRRTVDPSTPVRHTPLGSGHHALRAHRSSEPAIEHPRPPTPEALPQRSRIGLRTSALLGSAAAHAGLLIYLVGAEPPFDPPRLPKPPPTLVKLAPPPQPETASPKLPAPEPAEPVEPRPEPPKPQPQAARAEPRAAQPPTPRSEEPPAQAATPAPIALAGVTLSNSDFSVARSNPAPARVARSGSTEPQTTGLAAAQRRPPPAPKLVPLHNLSSKPNPPSLDAALRRHYPQGLRSRGIEGQAVVRLTLSPSGRVSTARIASESEPGFGAACRQTLLESRWSAPLDREGRAVGTQLTYRCRFRVH
jgi:protein TonB